MLTMGLSAESDRFVADEEPARLQREAEEERHRQNRLLKALKDTYPGQQPNELLRVVSIEEVSAERVEEAVWESMLMFYDRERGEGIWDPEVRELVEAPTDASRSAKILVLEIPTGTAHLVAHIGDTGIAGLLASY